MVEYADLIYYMVYSVWIAAFIVDWESISPGEEWMIWVVSGIIATGLCVLCWAFYDREFSSEGIIIAGTVCLAVVILAAVICYFWNKNAKWYRIKDKIRSRFRVLPHIVHQYGSDSEDIRRSLHLIGDDVFGLGHTMQLQEMWEKLMADPSGSRVKFVIRKIMGEELGGTDDYNLLWYLCISENPLGVRLNAEERRYITELKEAELEELLGDGYEGARDRASLLFAVLSGTYVPEFELDDRYERVKNYSPAAVYNLAFRKHKIIDRNRRTYSIQPPHVYLSKQTESQTEVLMLAVTADNCDEIIESLGLWALDQDELLRMDTEKKLEYVQTELTLYDNVLARPEGLIRPPPIKDMSVDEIMNTLSYYTNSELISAYEPRAKCIYRRDLLRQICNDVTGTSQWAFTHMHCTNDDTMNIITAELHGETNKDDVDDPTLSFGIHKNYRCYQASELEGSFREYDGLFLFRVPDWIPGGTTSRTSATEQVDLRTVVKEEFPIDSMKQLQTLLENAPEGYNVSALANKVKIGLEAFESGSSTSLYLKRQYNNFTEEQKLIARTYIAWMFMYAMWMRFWKGPGNPWPVTKVNVRRAYARLYSGRSSPEERDEHIFIQEAVRTSIIETFENDYVLLEWINSLPAAYYDFSTGKSSFASYPIKDILDKIAQGDYCMGFGSDTILKTSCHYIINMLDFKLGQSFDGFIDNMLPRMIDLEHNVVTTQMASLRNTNTSRYRVLYSRLTSLQQPRPIQQGFDPSNYENNTHVN